MLHSRSICLVLLTTVSLAIFFSYFNLSQPLHYISTVSGNSSHDDPFFPLRQALDAVSDSRVRISKLIGTSLLGSIALWIVFPSSELIVPGTNWYELLWDKHDFSGFKNVDDMIKLSPCQNYDKTFLQVGAHLGIFPLVATYRGCRGLAVEPMPVASHFSKISATLNSWGDEQFLAINAVGSHKGGGYVWFDPSTISIAANTTDVIGKLRIPVTTIDELDQAYGSKNAEKSSHIAFVIIDVEGHEQEVLLGAERLIRRKTVIVFEIEVWTKMPGKTDITSFPGLQLLVDNGYRLYTTVQNSIMNFKPCDEITNRLVHLPSILNETCQQPGMPKTHCLAEVFAVRNDFPEMRQWHSSCIR